jgi:glycosyltransferase involved in cell wall biosynthesis
LATFRRIRETRPDGLILQWWTTFWAPVWIVLLTLNRHFLKCPSIIICHNVLPHETRRWDPWLARLVLSRGTCFVAQSEEEKRQLQALLPQAPIKICPLPTFDMLVDHRVPKNKARERLGLPLETPVLLFFGIVREYKGLMDILLALPEVRERLGAVTLVVAGEFWAPKRSYLDRIQELGIKDSVYIDGRYIPDEQVGLYFSAADLLLAPYRTVTGSAAVKLARGFELPVVTTQVGGLAEVTNGEQGMLVPPADPPALAEAIVRYFETVPQHARQGHAGRQGVTWDDLAVVLETMLSEAKDRTRQNCTPEVTEDGRRRVDADHLAGNGES